MQRLAYILLAILEALAVLIYIFATGVWYLIRTFFRYFSNNSTK